VKTEAKPFASLSSGLLARKGAARPAMRPQGFGQVGAGLEDLGWNDMGFEPPKPANGPALDVDHDGFGEVVPAHPHNLAGLTPVDSPVHNQQAEIAGRLSAYGPDETDEEEELDETAELYDPDAVDEQAFEVEDEDEDEEEAIEVAEAPVFAEPVAVEEPVFVRPELPKAPAASAPRRARTPRAAPGSKPKAAFTLRLDQERHLKLRLACAMDGRSAQMLVTQALDDLLAAMPELDGMAAKAKRKG
jgi:hypothetical protein